MKKWVFLLAILTCFMFVSNNLFAETDCWIHRKTDPGQGGWKIYDDEQNKFCISLGTNCEIVPCSKSTQLGTIVPQSSGWIISANVASIELKKLTLGAWIDINRDGSYYTFSAQEKLIIDDCSAFPQLKNLQLDLNGITTDNNGNFSVYVPSL